MSPAQTEALLRRFVEALNASDWEAGLACLDEDVAIDSGSGERAIGRDAFREALATDARRVRRTIGDLVLMVSPDGAHAAAEFTLRGEAAGGEGGSFSVPAGLFFEVSDERITRISVRRGLDAPDAPDAR